MRSPSATRRAEPSRSSCASTTWRAATPRFLWAAFVLLPVALVFDVLDGYVARLDQTRQSLLGADLDSLADVISFGVAPAVLGFTLGLRGGWDMLILTYFVVCGVSRLARFNVTAAALADDDDREGEVLRRHADPDERAASSCCSAWRM